MAGVRCPECGGPAEVVDGTIRSTAAVQAPVRLVEGRRPAREALPGNRTFDEVSNLVTAALTNSSDGYPWLRDLTDEWVAYDQGDTTYQATYDIDDDGNVTFGDPQEVEPRHSYVTQDGQSIDAPVDGAGISTSEARQDRILGRVLEAKGTTADGGRIFEVQIIAYGDSKNGRRYPQSVMTAAAPLYEGAKAYDHHRTEAELQTSTIAGLVGSYRNVKATSTGLQAELHLLPGATHSAEALDASLAAVADGLPPVVGISHDVMANYQPVVTGGKRFMEATQIVSVHSADVVADPAAGGKATRMVAGGSGTDPKEGSTMTLKELLALLREATPEKRTELLQEHKATLDEFGLDEAAVGRILAPPASETTTTSTETGTGATGTETSTTTTGTETDTAPALGDPELVLAKESAIGRMLIRDAVTQAGLDAKFVESISARLPEKFTEATLATHVGTYADMRKELEKEGMLRSTESGGSIVPHISVTGEERDKKIKSLDAMLDSSPARFGEGYASLSQAFLDITGFNPGGMGKHELAETIMRESVGEFDSGKTKRGLESAQSGTWNLILGDSITRRMVAMYQQPNLQTWRAIVSSIVPIVDFRTQRIERLGGYGVLPGVNQGAPYQPLTTPGNEESTYAISKLGGTEDLTLETIANDDLRAVQRIPTLLGLAAAQTLYRYVWNMLITNAAYTADSTTLFSGGHGNTATTALSNGNLSAARAAMRQQTAYGDSKDILSILPKFLVVNSALEQLAYELTESAVALPTTAPDGGAAGNVPNLHQGMQAIVVDYFTATSTTNWFVVADPDLIPTIELGFYNGQVDPELFVQNDPTVGSVFTADKITYKIRHIYGGTPLDFRGFYRGNS